MESGNTSMYVPLQIVIFDMFSSIAAKTIIGNPMHGRYANIIQKP